MVAYRLVFLAGVAAALPLNINLGAYSPALVVGDGEISFGGNNDVNGLMSVLQGAAVNAANTAATQGAAAAPAAAAPAAAAPAAAAPAAAVPVAAAPPAPQTITPATVPAGQNQATDATNQAQQIAALQGMGKAVLPRQEEAAAPAPLAKREPTFDRALQFAEAALVKGPKVQLGTGEGGSGVGIIVDNNPTAAAAISKPHKKRDVPGSGRVKVTTMYVRSGLPTSLQNGNVMRARSEGDGISIEPRYETIQIAPSKRDGESSQSAVDAVNVNVSGDEGITMTFVETIDDGEDDL